MQTKATCPPWDDQFNAEDYVELDGGQIRSAFDCFDADPNVITCHKFKMDAILNGGIQFTRAGVAACGPAQEWLKTCFSRLAREVLRNRWAVGFVAVTWQPHALYTGEPVVLDLRQLVIKYRLNIYGQPEFRYFKPYLGTMDMQEVGNVHTFAFDPPDSLGQLRSLVFLLRPDYLQESAMAYFELVAIKNRAMPIMISESEQKPHDANAITSPLVARSAHARPDAVKTGVDMHTNITPVMDQSAQYFTQAQPASSDGIYNTVLPLVRLPFFTGHARLEEGRHFIAAPLPEGPGDYLLKYRMMRSERAFHLMGVPQSMLGMDSSLNGGSGSGDAKKPGMSRSAQANVLFDNSQQCLKLELIAIMKRMFLDIHMEGYLNEYTKSVEPDKWNAEDARKAVDITIEISSLPDQTLLMHLYTSGFMKFKSVVAYLSSKHGISPECFEDAPTVTVLELNGVRPEEPAAKKTKR